MKKKKTEKERKLGDTGAIIYGDSGLERTPKDRCEFWLHAIVLSDWKAHLASSKE